jgi:regulatory protein
MDAQTLRVAILALRQALHAAGVEESDAAPARELAAEEAARSALRFARRRRIGPFAQGKPDPKAREKALAAMIRAGHRFDLARRLVDCEPGQELDPEELASNNC